MRCHNTPLFIGIHRSMMFTETGFITKKRKDYLMSDNTQPTRQGLPSLPKSTIWMLSFGFLGVQTAFTLQSSQMSRIFQTLGADPHSLG